MTDAVETPGPEYRRVRAVDAQAGDEVYKAGEWCPIESVTPLRWSDNLTIKFVGGGTDSAPAHHFTVRRQIADGTTQIGESE
jgi:hypothetical protein